MKHALALFTLCLALPPTLVGCSSDTGGANDDAPVDDGFDDVRQALLESTVVVVRGELDTLVGQAEALQSATDAWVASGTAEDRAAAQDAWSSAMGTWQRLELIQVGPAGAMGVAVGGEDLRDEIYSWPLVNPCRVDQEIVEQAYTDAAAFAAEPVNVRGLDALEYLLFVDGTDNACAPNSGINTSGDWAAIDADALNSRRAAYAATLAELLTATATDLRGRWSDAAFGGELTLAVADTFRTRQDALNALSDAMFYLDKEVKDMKLAVPTGLTDCAEATCPDAVESPWSGRSLDNVRDNIAGFAMLYHGGAADDPNAVGFHDLLEAVGAADLAEGMDVSIGDIVMWTDDLDGTMVELIATDNASVIEVHDRIKTLTDLLKTQFVGVLDLELPDRAAGDND